MAEAYATDTIILFKHASTQSLLEQPFSFGDYYDDIMRVTDDVIITRDLLIHHLLGLANVRLDARKAVSVYVRGSLAASDYN